MAWVWGYLNCSQYLLHLPDGFYPYKRVIETKLIFLDSEDQLVSRYRPFQISPLSPGARPFMSHEIPNANNLGASKNDSGIVEAIKHASKHGFITQNGGLQNTALFGPQNPLLLPASQGQQLYGANIYLKWLHCPTG